MSEYHDHFEYDLPVAGGEVPSITNDELRGEDLYDEPFGEIPGMNLEHLRTYLR